MSEEKTAKKIKDYIFWYKWVQSEGDIDVTQAYPFSAEDDDDARKKVQTFLDEDSRRVFYKLFKIVDFEPKAKK